ncbi:uncharacterized protein LOC130591171 [Beta vulgaris subsp. vulgaris]|uniref:uncharacterized protein LOC130591171 n=1 Tax=Beta vulgaris subsp. vulgaris TaxID=3555 RepID=UPI002546D177|nr:uncharacterized protein LOC130591171 [Beta vulgaris subsp. vulgaris]
MEHANAFQQRPHSPYSNTYNPGWRDHPNFSYKSNNVQNPQPPPQSSYQPPHQNPPQHAARQPYYQGAPQNPPPGFNRPSPQGYQQQAPHNNSSQEPTISEDAVDDNEGEDSSRTEVERGKVDDAEKRKEKVTDSPTPPLPFPHRMQKSKVDQQLGKFMSMVKNLEVTVPFTDLISQVLVYAKFLKDMITKKKDFGGIDRVALTEECSAVLQNKIPPKLKDPGSFSIPCHVGALFIDKALCDLGASVSVMPLSVCNKLNLGALKCTQITLQMADRSVKYPLGILEDVPLRVGKFYIPVDFVVLDMEEDSQISIILGRPFLCTAGAVIDVKSGSLTFSVGDDTITFKLTNAIKSPMLEHTCCKIDILDEISGVSFSQFLSDELLETSLDLTDDCRLRAVFLVFSLLQCGHCQVQLGGGTSLHIWYLLSLLR